MRRAKEAGINVTCEVTPHHLTLMDEAVMGERGGRPFDALGMAAYDTYAKVNPPLRARADMETMAKGLADGTIDVIATDHAPHGQIEKLCTFEEAAMGISTLETALGSVMSLVHAGRLALPLMVEKLTSAPARFLDRTDIGTLRTGAEGDVTVFDPNAEWTVDTEGVCVEGEELTAARGYAQGSGGRDGGGWRGGVWGWECDMKVTYDQEVDILRIILNDADIDDSDEDKPGIIIDYDDRAATSWVWRS